MDFETLYELQDDQRKGRTGPLRFTRSLVTLSSFCSDAEVNYFERMRALKVRPERYLLRSILEDVVNWTGGKPFGHRGYLITCDGRPATSEYLAEQLGMSQSDIEEALPVLERLGFLERIPMNGQIELARSEPTPARRKRKTGGATKSKKTLKKGKQKSGPKSQNAAKHSIEGLTRVVPDSAGMKRNETESLCPPSRNGKRKFNTKVKINVGNDKSLRAKKNRQDEVQDEAQDQAQALKGTGQTQGARAEDPAATYSKAARAPTPTPPTKPTISDVGGLVTDSTGPPGSVQHTDDPSHVSHAVGQIRRRCNQAGMRAGLEVYAALGSPWAEGSVEAARETGCFGAQFEKVMASGLPPPGIVELWESLVAEARRLAKLYRTKGGYSSAAKVWCVVFRKKLDAAQQCSPPEKAAI